MLVLNYRIVLRRLVAFTGGDIIADTDLRAATVDPTATIRLNMLTRQPNLNLPDRILHQQLDAMVQHQPAQQIKVLAGFRGVDR